MPPPWQIVFSKRGNENVVVTNGQWFGFDGTYIRVLDHQDAEANYTITDAPVPPSLPSDDPT